MSDLKSMDLSKVQADISSKDLGGKPGRSLKNAKNLTAKNDLKDIHPVGNGLLVSLKSWPAQSAEGIFMPESYTVIRGEQYITQVEEVGSEVKNVSRGDVVIVSMYSGHHITTKTGHAKFIKETDILAFKKQDEMKEHLSFDPTTFVPGVNYILVELIENKTTKTESGIITEVGDDDAFNKNDVVTKTGKVMSIGPVNEFGKKFPEVKKGSVIIFDAWVGMDMNPSEVTADKKHKIMYATDILGYIDQK